VALGVCRYENFGTFRSGSGSVRLRSARFWKRDHIQVVKEDPEDFFGDVADFAGPELVWPRSVHCEDEGDWQIRLRSWPSTKVREDSASALFKSSRGRVCSGCQERDYEVLAGDLSFSLGNTYRER
jgi:hypothetical protein